MIVKRNNGFSWPPDKAQLFSLTILIYFGFIFFGTFTVSLKSPWSFIIGILYAIQYCILIILMTTVMYINPGEFSNVKKVTPSNFDRQKHKHVIENQFCNICQMIV